MANISNTMFSTVTHNRSLDSGNQMVTLGKFSVDLEIELT